MREISYKQAITESMVEEMRRDPTVLIIGEDVGDFGGLTETTIGIIDEFGAERVLETPISECGFVGAAIGAAMGGYRPIIELGLADVSLVAMDQIVNTAAKMNYFNDGRVTTSIVFRVWSGFRRSGGPQQSQSNEAMFNHVPGLKVVMPSTPYDMKGLMKASVRDPNPVVLFEPKACYPKKGEVPDEDYVIPLGVADVKREGDDATIIAMGGMVHPALQAAEMLSAEGISVEVVDPRTIRPLDKDTILKSVRKTGRALIVHEANVIGGVGGEIAAVIGDEAFSALKAPIKRIGGKETPVPVSPSLETMVVPQLDAIVETIRGQMNTKNAA